MDLLGRQGHLDSRVPSVLRVNLEVLVYLEIQGHRVLKDKLVLQDLLELSEHPDQMVLLDPWDNLVLLDFLDLKDKPDL